MKPSDKDEKSLRRNVGRSIKRTWLSIVTQVEMGSRSVYTNPATYSEATSEGNCVVSRCNTRWHALKDVE